MLRLLCFIGSGIILGGIVSAIVGPPGAASWAFPVGIIVLVFSAVLLGIGRSMRGVQLGDPKLVAAAVDEGRIALARVDSLTQTGTFINEQPLCEVELTVRPVNESAYRTVARRVVLLTEIPRFQPGSRHVVAVLAAGQPDVAFTEHDAGAEIWADTELPPAGAAGPVLRPAPGGLRANGTRRAPLIGTGRRGRPLRVAVFVIAGLLAGAAVVLPYRAGLAETLAAIPEGHLHADLREPLPLERALEILAAETGEERVTSITVSDDLVRIEAPAKPGSLNVDSWYVRRGSVTYTGAGSIQPESAGEFFDMTELDGAAVARAIDEAAELVADEIDTDAARDSLMYNVSRMLSDDPEDPWTHERTGPVVVNFTLSDAYRSANFRVNADGTNLERTDS